MLQIKDMENVDMGLYIGINEIRGVNLGGNSYCTECSKKYGVGYDFLLTSKDNDFNIDCKDCKTKIL